MLIQSSEQLRQICANGGHIRLNSQGQLVTQSRIRHVFEKIIDAFRSLSASGREAIKTRDAARDAAMRAFVHSDAMSNPSRTKFPRSTAQAETPAMETGQKDTDLERLQKEVHTLVQREVGKRFVRLDEQNRALVANLVEQELQELPGLAMSVSNPLPFLEEHVRQAVCQYTADIGAQASGVSAPAGRNATDVQAQIRTLAEEILSRERFQLDRQSRDRLLQGAVEQFHNLADVFEQADAETQRSLVGGYLKEAIVSMPPSGSSGRDFHCVRSLETERDITPDTIVRQGTNTCFMLSVLNSMMTSPRGRQILKENLLPGGRLWNTVRAHPHETPWVTERSYSELESLLASAYKPKDSTWKAGEIGVAVDFATIFGMTSACYNLPYESTDTGDGNSAEYQVRLPRPGAVETIRQRLEEGKMVLIRQNLHYMAVVGTDGDRLILRNSQGKGREEYVPISWLDGAEIDVLAYPEG